MEFVELIKEIIIFIPEEYAHTADVLEHLLPWLFIAAAVTTCFAGHKFHKIWTACIFFTVFFLLGCFLNLFFPAASIYLFIAIGCILGTAAVIFSSRLIKLQHFCFTAVLAYIAVSGFLLKHFIFALSIPASLAAALIAGILAMKYKYIVVMITTAVTGAMLSVSSIFSMTNLSSRILMTIIIVLLSAAGFAVQCLLEQEELMESMESFRMKLKKAD